jgi:ABC-type phosphate/phosphonate transport system substrate-binding protein
MPRGGILRSSLARIPWTGSPGLPGLWLPFRVALVLWLALGATLAQQDGNQAASSGGTNGLRRTRLYAIASSRMFTTVNRNDAVASIKAWFEVMGQEKGFLVDSKIDIVDRVTEIRRRLEERSVDILMLDFVDYLQLEASGLVVPDLVGHRGDGSGPLYSYLLVVGPSSTALTLADLRGKKMNYFSRNAASSSLAWMDVALAKLKLGRASAFFSTAISTPKPQACVLPLFFGVVDACVVDEINLAVLKEMNPQLGKLRVLARSMPLIESLIATPVQTHPHRKELLDTIMQLHHSPRGKQLLVVFKAERLLRITPGDIEAARTLWMEYRRIAGSLPGSAPQPAASSHTITGVTAANGSNFREKD